MLNVIHYRNKCIGCNICFEMQPELWRLSKKDGKASLLKAKVKNQVHVLSVPDSMEPILREVAEACPVNIIKLQ